MAGHLGLVSLITKIYSEWLKLYKLRIGRDILAHSNAVIIWRPMRPIHINTARYQNLAKNVLSAHIGSDSSDRWAKRANYVAGTAGVTMWPSLLISHIVSLSMISRQLSAGIMLGFGSSLISTEVGERCGTPWLWESNQHSAISKAWTTQSLKHSFILDLTDHGS